MSLRLEPSAARIAIAGAGIVGLSIAAVLAEAGHRLTVFDPLEPGRGASWAAAGMLAPAYEAAGREGHHPRLLEACFESKRLWADWADWLGADVPGGLRFVGTGSFALATTDAEVDALTRMAEALEARGEPVDRLSRPDLLRWEPGLGEGVRSGLALASDGRVDNRAVVAALRNRLAGHAGVRIERAAPPLELAAGGLAVDGHDLVVLAAGFHTPELRVAAGGETLRLADVLPELRAIQPVKGQMLAVQGDVDRAPSHTLRLGHIYIVPRHDRVIIGATSEPGIGDRLVEGRAIADLKAAAVAVLPDLERRPTLETWAGVRPGSPDHAPLIGPASRPGVLLACGHHRNGILLSPLTARIIAEHVAGEAPGPLGLAFSPGRIAPAPV